MRLLSLSLSCKEKAAPPGASGASYDEGVSKRDRARQALAGKSTAELAEVARRMGVHLGDYALEEIGLALIEEGAAPITEIMLRETFSVLARSLIYLEKVTK